MVLGYYLASDNSGGKLRGFISMIFLRHDSLTAFNFCNTTSVWILDMRPAVNNMTEDCTLVYLNIHNSAALSTTPSLRRPLPSVAGPAVA